MSMPSRSSSSHPESTHPYRDTRSQSTTSLTTSTKKRSWMSHLMPKTRREDLLPLPEGARLSSPPPTLPNILHTSLELPSPGTYARFAARVGGFEVGRDIRPVAPATNYDTWADRNPTPPPAAGVASSEFWDNVDIPYSAYFPSPRANSPNHRTPPPGGYAYEWDQPAPREQALEPVRIEAPIASTSAHIYPAPRSGWRNVRSPVRSPHRPPRASRWQQIADRIIAEQQHEEPEPTRNTEGDWPTESSSDTSTAVNPPRPATPFRPAPDHVADSTLSRRDSRPPTPTEMTLSSAINFYEETINDPSIAIPTIP